MSEWQPAVYLRAHWYNMPEEERVLHHGDRIFVRKIKTPLNVRDAYRSLGCDSEHFFEVSRDGKTNLLGYYHEEGLVAICLHEIATD